VRVFAIIEHYEFSFTTWFIKRRNENFCLLIIPHRSLLVAYAATSSGPPQRLQSIDFLSTMMVTITRNAKIEI
jgi:hypothetical protein